MLKPILNPSANILVLIIICFLSIIAIFSSYEMFRYEYCSQIILELNRIPFDQFTELNY